MLDRRTQLRLMSIGRSIPKALLKRGVRKERPFAFERELVLEAIRDPRTPLDVKRKLQRALQEEKLYNTYERTTDVTDPEVDRKIDAIVGAKVASEMRRGRLPPPPKDDPLRRKIAANKELHRRGVEARERIRREQERSPFHQPTS